MFVRKIGKQIVKEGNFIGYFVPFFMMIFFVVICGVSSFLTLLGCRPFSEDCKMVRALEVNL